MNVLTDEQEPERERIREEIRCSPIEIHNREEAAAARRKEMEEIRSRTRSLTKKEKK